MKGPTLGAVALPDDAPTKLSATELRGVCDAILARLLVPGGLIIAGLYALFAIAHLLVAPGRTRLVLAATAFISSLLITAHALLVRRANPHPRYAHAHAAVVATVAITNIWVHAYVAPDPRLTYPFAVLVLSAGLILLSRVWLAIELAASSLAFVLFVVRYPHFDWAHYVYLYAAIAGLAALVHEMRLRATARLETLQRSAEYHRDQAERALARERREFEERIRIEREQRVLDRRVAESQRLESLGIMAGGVAHDFNNILTSVIGNAEWILDECDAGDPRCDPAHRILDCSRGASELTRQMLDYAGRAPTEQSDVVLAELVSEIEPLARSSLPRGVDLDLTRQDEAAIVHGDSTQLMQVILNLVTNSGEALAEDGGLICVETRLEQGRAQLIVRDNGPGIPVAIRSRIFDPFFSTKFTGRGLGLAAVLGIVRLHDGTILVEDSDGVAPDGTGSRGAIFRVTLPARPASSEARSTPQSASPESRLQWDRAPDHLPAPERR